VCGGVRGGGGGLEGTFSFSLSKDITFSSIHLFSLNLRWLSKGNEILFFVFSFRGFKKKNIRKFHDYDSIKMIEVNR